VELIAISIVTMRSIWHKVCVRLFTFWKISAVHLRICGATYRHSYESFSALQSTSSYSSNRCWKLRPNWFIIGHAILPQNAAKLTVLNWPFCCGAIWRRGEKP